MSKAKNQPMQRAIPSSINITAKSWTYQQIYPKLNKPAKGCHMFLRQRQTEAILLVSNLRWIWRQDIVTSITPTVWQQTQILIKFYFIAQDGLVAEKRSKISYKRFYSLLKKKYFCLNALSATGYTAHVVTFYQPDCMDKFRQMMTYSPNEGLQ